MSLGQIGKKYSNETKVKRSKAMKSLWARPGFRKKMVGAILSGEKHPMYGRTHTRTAREKIRKALTGRKLSEQHKKKLSLAGMGRKMSERNRCKLIKRLKGNKYSLGKKRSEEYKRNFSIARTGLKHSDEAKRKMSESYWKSNTRRGEKHYNWKGGITPLCDRIRRLSEYKKWRKLSFQRDNYTCVKCQQKGGTLNVDHYPKSFSDIFYENKITSVEEAKKCADFWDIKNGRTLCLNCHKKTETYAGKTKQKYERKRKAERCLAGP